MSFAWLFSIIVGAIIIFLAIFAATRLIGTNEFVINTKTAAELRNVLDPLQTTLEEGKSEQIEFVRDTRVFITCNSELGNFGENRIRLSERSGFGDQWSDPGGDVSSENQYLFAEEVLEGQNLYFFIFPFNMPYKVADIMMPFSDEYCFVQPPTEIRDELEDLSNGLPINITNNLRNCNGEATSVCFTSSGCDINVRGTCQGTNCESAYDSGVVSKEDNSVEMAYSGNLMYGAIFASKNNYECNVKRLMRKLSYVSNIHSQKAGLIAGTCDTGLQSDTNRLTQLAGNYQTISDLQSIEAQAEIIANKNRILGECRLF